MFGFVVFVPVVVFSGSRRPQNYAVENVLFWLDAEQFVHLETPEEDLRNYATVGWLVG
jgi:hypothetical protein